ncbi:hypothetical protein RUM44_000641 [Polyplax serrata]|uniref:Uncharacterized protein n=1 Tax=Polyplax serrata TaxID=468196 RepID=A0ABR1B5Z3_POLSC
MESPPILNAMKLRTKKKAEHMGDVGPRRTNQRSPKSTNPEEINVFGFHCGQIERENVVEGEVEKQVLEDDSEKQLKSKVYKQKLVLNGSGKGQSMQSGGPWTVGQLQLPTCPYASYNSSYLNVQSDSN